jgi:arylsulfatase
MKFKLFYPFMAVMMIGFLRIHRFRIINLEQYLPATKISDTIKTIDAEDIGEGEGLEDSTPSSSIVSPMNIVLLYADDWTFHTLGAMGNSYVQTPNLDQLAKEGILFTHNCVVASICMQSRATLYTGQYSSVHQTFFIAKNITMYEGGRWNNTLYPLMLGHGYHVGFFGKYHHSLPPGPTFSKFSSTRMSHFVSCHGEEKHVTQCNEDDGIKFLSERPHDKPFFLTLSFFATHAEDGNPDNYRPMETSSNLYNETPVPLPRTYSQELNYSTLPPFFNHRNFGRGRFRGRYDTPEKYQDSMKKMYRMATEVDETCGKIISALKEQGVYNNTVIIFTTDNGNFHGEHGLAEKWYAYEESIRVPLIIKDPRMLPNRIGTENSEFTLNVDLAPTILSAANIVPPNVMQGRDISALYKKNHGLATASWRKDFLYEYWNAIYDIPNSIALVGKGFKFIYWTDHNYTQYFDLESDPSEEYDIFSSADKTLLYHAQQRLDEIRISASSGMPQ